MSTTFGNKCSVYFPIFHVDNNFFDGVAAESYVGKMWTSEFRLYLIFKLK